MASKLFSPFTLRTLALKNRIVVSPMCQYSAEDGVASDWHMAHVPTMAVSGAGLTMIEMTDVEAAGRITLGCLGLYSDACEAALQRVVRSAKRWGGAAMGIQLAHAGRKGSTHKPWDGGAPLQAQSGAWQTVAPSAIPFAEGWPAPAALTEAEIDRIVGAFAAAARRALRVGIDLVELHGAHGYLLHQFQSPLSNKRTDKWGGSAENRLRFPLRVVEAVRAVWPEDKPLGIRISCHEWTDGGLTPDDAVVYARALKMRGVDYLCCSGGGNVATAKIPVAPGYMVEFAAKVRREAGIATRAIGMILTARQAETIVAESQADMVALARGFLDDPRWGWHAAEALGAPIPAPPQYQRATRDTWPGAKLVRPTAAAAE
ncbi:MAG TPA: NADH:flavin oxidoreductase/NADH oxidase [Stellaceae bacterium]|nr:NADH:flavin oxidoreductase/NADH oxidase [Stellaceae bacterium]